ncbi:tetraacyldisaccharide 4'-kinase [Tianweitania sp. BSSL-BM11]|uniref:Tetraacyldisaccharide 4'-kinase n=1 Tax=Tianweitania aestuarii TaxID=2814886 RepID=A0ABS5RT59_9HYPH|nr:tetraacyldisaccharide 4'-kinase [Tianweitania aestuarii]MBS9719507.1 tetraacyldisaccharide 4'-kinase [Tianweitania aestuarii]
MGSEAPPFWWEQADWRAWSLWPASALYGAVAKRQMRRAPRVKIAAPVLCIGNYTVGGAGKTPVAIAMAKSFMARGFTPGILSRGHGGSFGKPHLVDPHHDIARHVGDEPLLLAGAAPVAVSADRQAGARLLLDQGCDALIMDDGFQSARIHIDFALLVVDAIRGVGNGHVIPGGPLRAGLVEQLRFTDAVLKMGKGTAGDAVIRKAARAGRPMFEAHTQLVSGQDFAGRRFLAFAGIGNNAKFFDTVREAGGELAGTRSFPDHHAYAEDELADLERSAADLDATLITTAKDAARLRGWSPATTRFLEGVDVLAVEAAFDNPTAPQRIVDATINAYKQRRTA